MVWYTTHRPNETKIYDGVFDIFFYDGYKMYNFTGGQFRAIQSNLSVDEENSYALPGLSVHCLQCCAQKTN